MRFCFNGPGKISIAPVGVNEFYCVDVGSRGGFHDMRLLHPLINMYSLDADTTMKPPLQKFASFHHFPLALYSSEGEMDMFITAILV